MGSPVHLRGRGFRVFAAVLIVGALLPLAACGNDTSASQAPSSSGTQSQTPSPSQSTPKITLPKQNSRGNIIKHVGEKASLLDANSRKEIVSVIVTSITMDPQCTAEYAEPSKAGHMVEFDIKVQTSEDFDSDDGPLLMGNSGNWTYILKDGTQWNGSPGGEAAMSCLPEEQRLPTAINKGIKAQGKVIFNLHSNDGSHGLIPCSPAPIRPFHCCIHAGWSVLFNYLGFT